MPTTWRVLDRIDTQHLGAVRAARAAARARAWAAGAGPDLDAGLMLDFDATITIAHSEKENAAATWKRTFGFYPLLCFLDRPDISGGEALAGLLRPGNAGSNTAADHITVLDLALAALPAHARPTPGPETGTWAGPRVVARSDSAGATHAFAQACVDRGVGFSFGFPVDARIQRIVDLIPDSCWHPALQTDRAGTDGLREGAWVAEATGMIDLSSWPEGSRLILRKEHPHPGAQLTFTDADGLRVTAILTNTPATGPGVVPGQAAGLELRHRQHARVEDRIREAKATGLRNLPSGPSPRTTPGSKSSSRPSTSWPGPRRSASPRSPRWPAARSPRSATACCTSPPGSPAAPDKSDCASTRPGAGPPTSPKASTDSAPRSPDHPRARSPDPQTRRPAHRQRQPAYRHAHHQSPSAETGKPDIKPSRQPPA